MPLPDELQIFSKLTNPMRWGVFCIALLSLAILKYPRYFTWNGLKNFLHFGISWEQNGWLFLGMTGSANPTDTRITGFQLRGFNNSRQPLRNAQARLILANGDELPLRITTSGSNADTAPYVEIAPRTTLQINGQFESQTPKDFIARHAPLNFLLEWSTGNTSVKFSQDKIEKLVHRYERSNAPKPDAF